MLGVLIPIISVSYTHLCYIYDGEYQIYVRVIERYDNMFELSDSLSNDLYLFINRISKAILFFEKADLTVGDIVEIGDSLKNKLLSLDLFSNYLLIEAEVDFLIHIDRLSSLKYCKAIVQEIISIINEDVMLSLIHILPAPASCLTRRTRTSLN